MTEPRGDSTVDFTVSILARIADRAREAPTRYAMREVRGARTVRTISREALVARTLAMAHGLTARGFRRGDRVLFSVRPGIDAVCLVLAVHELGGVLIPQDPGTADALFAARMALLAPQWVFAESMLLGRSTAVVSRLLKWQKVSLAPVGELQGVQFVRAGPWLPGLPPAISVAALVGGTAAPQAATAHAPMSTAAMWQAEPPASPHDEAFIVCTSGTTAAPKAVVHTRASLASILHTVSRELAPAADDVVYARDLHLLLPALCRGALAVVPREFSARASRTLRALSRFNVTHAFFTTRDCRLLVEACEAAASRFPRSLRSLMIGAAPVRSPFLARLAPLLPEACEAWCVYGATEMLPIARVDLHEKLAYTGAGDLIGRPVAGAEVRLDHIGQLLVSGPSLCAGYAGQPAMREHATGDLARCEGDRLVLLGRLKDMIIRGDHNIYPELYEPLVERIPGVRRAAMLGDFSEADADERVVLVVEPDRDQSAEALRERVWNAVRTGPLRLDRSALPDEVRVATLPDAGRSHKLDKRALRVALGLRAPGE